MDTSSPGSGRRRLVGLVLLTCVAVAAGSALAVGLSRRPTGGGPDGRPVSAGEARRMAAVRVTNHRTGRVGLRAEWTTPAGRTGLAGWLDWDRPLAYLAVDGSGAGARRGLVQAVPGVLVTRPEPPGAPTAGQAAAPPPTPPADGWRVRPLGPADPDPTGLADLLGVLFGLAAEQPDDAGAFTRGGARWLRRDRIGDVAVDVLLAPTPVVVPGSVPAAPSGVPAGAGAARYWIDRQAGLRRLELTLAPDVPVRIDLDRTAQPELTAVGALGGRPVRPRAVTDGEADLLAGMRPANHSRAGARVRLTVPTRPTANLRGAGWVDWRHGVTYLRITDADRPGRNTLLRADRQGVATRPAPRDRADQPPLPPPSDRGWSYGDWQRRADDRGGLDLDLLVNEVIAVGRSRGDEPRQVRTAAVWLRADRVDGHQVTVFELPKPAEAGLPPGRARLRYWVDGQGLLRRLELRTRVGAFAQLDLRPGPVPRLPAVPVG